MHWGRVYQDVDMTLDRLVRGVDQINPGLEDSVLFDTGKALQNMGVLDRLDLAITSDEDAE